MFLRRLILGILVVSLFCGFKMNSGGNKITSDDGNLIDAAIEGRVLEHISKIKALVKENSNFNKQYAFLLDMKIMSGKNRFFVYDLVNNKIIDQGLVAHGLGSGMFSDLRFSNENNSYCTSLGKYYIGKSYFGEFGKAYKLFGLESTNSNAFSRNIVLHQYDKVPYEEQETYICNSLGCPMVNRVYYSRIQKLIDNSKSNIILDIYY